MAYEGRMPDLGESVRGLLPLAVPEHSVPHVTCPFEHRDGEDLIDLHVGVVSGRGSGA